MQIRRERGAIIPLLFAIACGLIFGLGLFTFGYARGSSYMTDNPEACANCHVMRENFESWLKSSHKAVAVCNDCHTPAGVIPKYATKALNGFFHSLAFTTQQFPDHIQITKRNWNVAETACLKCHAEVVSGIRATREHKDQVSCIVCHRSVGHM